MPSIVTGDLVEQRILEAYAACNDNAVVTGWAALRLHGGAYFDGLAGDGLTRLPVPVAANGGRMRCRPDVMVSRLTVPPDEVVVIQGIRCAVAERALFDELRRLHGPRERTVAIDMACAAQLTSIRRMSRYLLIRRWYRDVRTVRPSLDLAEEHSWSPQESWFRMIWEVDAGWGHPMCNREVFDLDGRFIGIPDLLDPRRGIVGEFAGEHHRDRERHASDVARAADFRAVGLEYVEVVGRDVRSPSVVVRRLKQAEERAGVQPCGWRAGPAPPTLDEILDQRDRDAVVE